MNSNSQDANSIDKVSDRPLLTYVVLCYNHARFLKQAVESAFAQDYSPLQIIISDDASSDESPALLRELCAAYNGPHRVILNLNTQRQGLGGHLNQVAAQAEGGLIVYASGDDVSFPQRTREIYAAWNEGAREAAVVYSWYERIDERGNILELSKPPEPDSFGLIDVVVDHRFIIGAACAWRRDVFTAYSPLLVALKSEDVVLILRALQQGGMACVPRVLMQWRVVTNSLSNQITSTKLDSIKTYLAWEYDRAERKRLISQQHYDDTAHAGLLKGRLGAVVRRQLARAQYRAAIFGSLSGQGQQQPAAYILAAMLQSGFADVLGQALKLLLLPLSLMNAQIKLKRRMREHKISP